jgi:hypothetical protein
MPKTKFAHSFRRQPFETLDVVVEKDPDNPKGAILLLEVWRIATRKRSKWQPDDEPYGSVFVQGKAEETTIESTAPPSDLHRCRTKASTVNPACSSSSTGGRGRTACSHGLEDLATKPNKLLHLRNTVDYERIAPRGFDGLMRLKADRRLSWSESHCPQLDEQRK